MGYGISLVKMKELVISLVYDCLFWKITLTGIKIMSDG